MGVYQIISQPWYDHYNQCYFNTLTIDKKPTGVLANHVRRVQMPKISPFIVRNNCCPENECPYVIYKNSSESHPICENDYTWLLSFLLENSYRIDYEMTRMINESEFRNSKNRLLCFFSD